MAHEQAEEDEFRRRTLERFAEEDRLEQMNAQKRRLKVAEHVREVNRLVAEKRAMYEAARVSGGQPVQLCVCDCAGLGQGGVHSRRCWHISGTSGARLCTGGQTVWPSSLL